jgi:hypothetical protein
MANDIESDIRRALDAKAHEVDVPADLATRTIEAAHESARPSLRDRFRARADAWRLRGSVTGYPRWALAGAAAATAVLLFFVGTLVRPDPVALDQPVAQPAIGAPTVVEDSAGSQGFAPGAEPAQRDEAALKEAPDVGTTGGGTSSQIAPIPPAPSRPGQFPPKIVRTANAEIEVSSFERSWTQANAIAQRYRGYVTNAQAGLERGTVTMRVPAANLDKAMTDLRKLGKVVQMTTTAEDVSGSIVDIDARLRVLKAEEAQLLELLRRASGVSETLEVRTQLNAIRQEIESFETQKEYFADQVDYATINATVFERGADDPDDPGDGILIEAWRTALRAGLTIIAGALVVLGGLIPLAALGLAIWLAVRTIRRRRA